VFQTIRFILREAIARLDHFRIDAPALTARLLLAKATSKTKEWLLAHDDESLEASTIRAFDDLLNRVVSHEPLAYVLGHREFFGLDFIVDSRVLIPRPETEMLVELTLPFVNRQSSIVTRQPSFVDVVDVGTGSGAIAIAIAKHAPDARLIACDISIDALAVAKLNAERNNVAERIAFIESDLLSNVEAMPTIITANLPYVTREEIDGLPPEIQDHEPRVALDGGEDGLDLVRRLLTQIAGRQTTSDDSNLRAAFFEIGASQGHVALRNAQDILPQARFEIKKDLAKRDRVLVIEFEG
jgi:release factor glutamine methyltransferase